MEEKRAGKQKVENQPKCDEEIWGSWEKKKNANHLPISPVVFFSLVLIFLFFLREIDDEENVGKKTHGQEDQ